MTPNRKPQKPLPSFAVSIDKLEEVTQLDFLNLLPQKVQKQLEVQGESISMEAACS